VDGKKRRMDEIKDQVVQANKQLEQVSEDGDVYHA